jgi:hypothetical protein
MNQSIRVLLTALAALSGVALGQDAAIPWREIEPFFEPPSEYKGKFGDFRSVMKFDDGSIVHTADDWRRRREEILKYWQGALGRWPALLDKQGPAIEPFILSEIRC